jgi:gamma-glutamyl-gamma-aminobutyrate hydrolase PuuD
MNLVGISQRVDFHASHQENRDCLDQRWWDFLKTCHLTPLILPNNINLVAELLQNLVVSGIILTGGNQTPERDEVEIYLTKFAIHKKIPLIGVCHGMQVIQRYYNVLLYPVDNQVTESQEIIISGAPAIVNSYHNLGTYENHSDFEVFAKTKDGIIKAIKHKSFPITGIMWHPERNQPLRIMDIKLFEEIFNIQNTRILNND